MQIVETPITPEKKLQPRQEIAIISGAHGFIGSYLSEALTEKGIKAIAIPREILLNEILLREFVIQHQPDYIFHLATVGNYGDEQNSADCIIVNVLGTHNLLDASRNVPYKAFINFSSSATLLNFETFYTATKKSAEHLCRAFVDKYSLPIVTVRPATVIGPGEQKQHLIPRLIDSCLSGKEMSFAPSPSHDFVDVRDVVKAVILLMDSAWYNRGKAFNIATGVSLTNKRVKELVEEITKRKARVIEDNNIARSYDSTSWHVDPMTLRATGWRSKYTLSDSIKAMVKYYKKG